MADRLTKDNWRDPDKVLSVNAKALQYQVPGGMLSNLIGQLKQANAMDKYYTVLEEVPRVRKDFGRGFYMAMTPHQAIGMMHKKYREAVRRSRDAARCKFAMGI